MELSHFCIMLSFLFLAVLGFELRASCLLGGALPLEPHPSALYSVFQIENSCNGYLIIWTLFYKINIFLISQ
jgi:hypothetical protein